MFATLGLLLKLLPLLGPITGLFSSIKKFFSSTKNNDQKTDCPDTPNDQYHSSDGCDYPICNNPNHQHTKDLESKKEALRKRRRRF